MKAKNPLFTFFKTVLMAFALSFGVSAYAESIPETETAPVQDSQAQIENVIDSHEVESKKESSVDEKTIIATTGEKSANEKESEAIASDSLIEEGKIESTADRKDGKTKNSFEDSVNTEEKVAVKSGKKSGGESAESEDVEYEPLFPDYSVDFHYNDLKYSLGGGGRVKLNKILQELKITGSEIDNVQCSNSELFSASAKNGEWLVSSHKKFESNESMKVTIDGRLYDIAVTDATYWYYVMPTASNITTTTATMTITMDNLKTQYPVYELNTTNNILSIANGSSSNITLAIPDDAKFVRYSSDDYTTLIGSNIMMNPTDQTATAKQRTTWRLGIGVDMTSCPYAAQISSIGARAFSGWSMQKLTLSCYNYLTTIGNSAFSSCSSLNEIDFMFSCGSLTTIDANAFNGCSSLDEIYIPSSVTTIGSQAFRGTASNANIYIGNTYDNIQSMCGNNVGDRFEVSAIYNTQSTSKPKVFHFKCGDNICYKIQNNAVVISNEMATGTGDYSMWNWDYSGSNISPFNAAAAITTFTTVNFDAPATTIGNYAFYGCTALQKAWPSGVSEPSRKEVIIPNSITSIGTGAFEGCTSVEYFSFQSTAQVTALSGAVCKSCSGLKGVVLPNSITSIGAGTFQNCTALTDVTLSTNLASIGSEGFRGCSSLTGITLPNSLTSIDANAFRECTGLASVTFPNNLTTIGDYAFRDCSSLASVVIPASVTSIGSYAFWGIDNTADIYYASTDEALQTVCDNDIGRRFDTIEIFDTEVTAKPKVFHFKCGDNLWYTIQENIVTISKDIATGTNYAMWNWDTSSNLSPFNRYANKFTSVKISDATTIGSYAFYGCTTLSKFYPSSVTAPSRNEIIIPNTITATGIGTGAFKGCTSVEYLTFQATSNITTLGESIFEDCTGLTTVVLPNTVTALGTATFKGCSSLSDITLSTSLATIGQGTFCNCSGLTTFNIPGTITSIGQDAFDGTPNDAVFYCGIGYNKASLGTYCKNSGGTAQNIGYSFDNNANQYFYFQCGDALYYILNDTNTTATIVRYPSGGSTAMWNWTNSSGANRSPFSRVLSTLTTVNFGPATTVGDYAFDNCVYITNVDLSSMTSIGEGSFYYCQGLRTITIPDTVVSIGDSAFGNCSLCSEVIINPNASLTIGSNAFEILTNAHVYYNHDSSVRSNPESSFASHCETSVEDSFGYGIGDDTRHYYFRCGDNLWYTTITSSSTDITIGKEISTGSDLTMWNYSTSSTSPFYNSSVSSLIINDATSIGSYAFYRCTGLNSYTIPSNVTVIGDHAFDGCSDLSTLVITPSVTSIGSNAFVGLRDYASIYYDNPQTDRYSPETTLNGKCSSTGSGTGTYARIYNSFGYDPNSTEVGSYYFYFKCGDNLWYTIYDGVAAIDRAISSGSDYTMWNYTATTGYTSPFYNRRNSIGSLYITDATTIGDYALYMLNSSSFTTLTIPNTVVTLGTRAISDCDYLTSVTFEANSQLTTIGTGAFYSSDRLTSIELPSSVTTIGDEAFRNCSAMESFEVPTTVTSIGQNSFAGLKSGAKIYYENPQTDRYSPEATLNGKCSSTGSGTGTYARIFNSFGHDLDSTATGHYIFCFKCGDDLWYNISEGTATIEKDSAATGTSHPVWDYSNGNTPFYNRRSSITAVVINDATSTGAYTFDSCTSITGVTISDSVTAISRSTFEDCTGLTSVTIPDSVTVIGNSAFNTCSSLESVIIPTSIANVTSGGSTTYGIGQNAFYGLKTGANVYYYAKQSQFTPICYGGNVTGSFSYGVGASNNLLFHFIQDIKYMDGAVEILELQPDLYETNSGNSVVLPVLPDEGGYRFDGWFTDSTLETGPVTSFTADNTQFGDKVYYAKLTLVSRSIIYHCEGGSIADPQVTTYVPGSGLTLNLDIPTWAGHAFCGWHESSTLSDAATLTFEVGTNTTDKDFYAEWFERVNIPYWANGQDNVLSSSTPYEVVKSCDSTLGTAGQTTWYVLKDDAIENSAVTLNVAGDVRLILKDGCKMLLSNIVVDAPNSLTIYAQHSDDYYEEPINLPDVETLKLRMLQNIYYFVNNKRYYLEQDSASEHYILYNADGTEVYVLDEGSESGGVWRQTATFDTQRSQLDILAIPKANTGDDYTDDNGEVYTWSGTYFENSTGDRFEFYQEDSSESGYSYWRGPIKNSMTFVAETSRRGISRFLFDDGSGHYYYLDHDDEIAPSDYNTSGTQTAKAREGDYVYSPTQPDKKYYYVNSSFNGSAHTFRYTDGETTETLTLYASTTYIFGYTDDVGNRYFAHYNSQLGKESVVNLADNSGTEYVEIILSSPDYWNPSESVLYLNPQYFVDSSVDLSAYQDGSGHFTNGHIRGAVECEAINSPASIGSGAVNMSSGAITIYGGDIKSYGNIGSAGKTAGYERTVTTGNITIYGGKIYSDTGENCSIGGGENMSGGNIAIHGGQIVASYIGAGEGVGSASDDTNLSIEWTSKTDKIVLNGNRISSFSVDDDHKFVLGGEIMIDSSSVINSKSDLPLSSGKTIVMYPYYASDISYMLTIPGRTTLPFRFTSCKFGSADSDSMSISSYSETPGETGGASYPYSLAVIITKNHFIKDGSSGEANTTLAYSLRDYETDVGVVNKCFIMSDDNDRINYNRGAVSELGGSKNIRLSVNDASVWSTLASGIYRSRVSFTVGLCTV